MKVLITGALGFVGQQFVQTLWSEKSKMDLVGVDTANFWSAMDCRTVFRQNDYPNFDLVIHCAATIPDIHERRSNQLVVAEDLALDAEMFQWALRTRPKQVVYFSSAATYPIHLQQADGHRLSEYDIDLNHLANPDEMYGFTKLAGEIQAMEARRQGLNVMIVRPFTGYGTTQAKSYPFRAMIERAKAREDPFEVWGSGEQVRDFIHIQDIVQAVLTMNHYDFQGPVNLGTGRATSMLELARMITSAAGYEPEIVTKPDKPSGAFYRCADPTYMHTIYKPEITLEEGIERALDGDGG